MRRREALIKRAADHARVGRLGIAKLAGLVDRLAGQAQVGDGGNRVLLRNAIAGTVVRPYYLAPLLRRVVLIRQPALGLRFDLERWSEQASPCRLSAPTWWGSLSGFGQKHRSATGIIRPKDRMETRVPRYYFNVYDGHSSRDMDGTELQSRATAQLMAVKLAGEILRDEAEGVVLDEDWRLEVVDAAGCVVFEVHVLLSANQPLKAGLPN